MAARMGINVPGPDNADPAAIAATGASWVRTVYRDNLPFRSWLTRLKSVGIDCLLVGDSSPESLGDNEDQWAGRMTVARSNLGDLVKCFQWGNESDGTGIASWTMSQARVNRLLTVARTVFPRSDYTLVAPGMVSGQADWLQGVRLDLVDVVDAHPYSKFVDTDASRHELNWMLDRYRDLGKPLWLGEFDARTAGLASYLRDYPGVDRAAVFCWDSNQTAGEGITGMGIKDNPTAMASFLAATGGRVVDVPPVVLPPAHFQQGFETIALRHPDLVGRPLRDERGPWHNCSTQPTSTGILIWGDFVGAGSQMGFVGGDGRLWIWTGDHLEAA